MEGTAPQAEAQQIKELEAVPLDEVTVAMLADLVKDARGIAIAQQTVLEVFKRRYGLKGNNWRVSEDGKTLIREKV